jgi:hypothetical protein
MQDAFLAIREKMNPVCDSIQVIVDKGIDKSTIKKEALQRMLKLEGVFRSSTRNWDKPAIKVSVKVVQNY